MRKGQKHSEETKNKMSLASKGKSKSEEHKRNLSIGMTGVPHYKARGFKRSEENKEKIRNTLKIKGIAPPNRFNKLSNDIKNKISESLKKIWNNGEFKRELTDEYRNKMSLARIGKTMSKETRAKMSLINKGKVLSKETRFKMKIAFNTPKHKLLLKERRAKQIFPIKDTSIEVEVQNFLKQLDIDFFTHQYIKNIEHGYQCDILIPSMNLVIECDGNYWHKYPIGNDIDHIRTKELIEKGFKVLRLWESEIRTMSLESFNNKYQEHSKI